MRLKQSRLKEYFHKKRTVEKDSEGGTSDVYGAASSVIAEVWPAGGKVQAELYGHRLAYIRNMRIDGAYTVHTDENGLVHYVLESGVDIVELDGICLYVSAEQNPDYKIISIRPYRFLKLEVERL